MNTDCRHAPLTLPEQLGQPRLTVEIAWRLSDADAMVVNLPAVAGDLIPGNNGQSSQLEREVAAAWLVDQAAVMSATQVAQDFVNDPIRISGRRVVAYRPPRYGRSLVIPVEVLPIAGVPGEILVDVKGCGVAPGRRPASGDHQNGLLLLSQAFEEYVMQRVLESVLAAAGVRVRGLPVYGILMLDFTATAPAGGRQPAGLLVRRSHRRPLEGVELAPRGSDEQRVQLIVELILRRYGLTSASESTRLEFYEEAGRLACRYAGIPRIDVDEAFLLSLIRQIGPDPPRAFEAANIQYVRGPSASPLDVTLVDFGHYEARERFDLPLLSLVRDRRLQWGGFLRTDDPNFVQPDPDERVDWKLMRPRAPSAGLRRWAGLDDEVELTGAAAFGLELAHDLSHRRMTGPQAEAAIDDFVGRAVGAAPARLDSRTERRAACGQ